MLSGLKATDLAYNQNLDIRLAPAGAPHLLELPFSARICNHLGTVHAAAQFSLAEAASAECLQRCFAPAAGEVVAVMRRAEVKYRQAATGVLLAFGEPETSTREQLLAQLTRRHRAFAMILIDLKDRAGTLVFHGKFEWFISRAQSPSP
jgi:acyl-coenzyme A thioesterase PaaI-like protein